MSIKYGESKKQYVKGTEVRNLTIFVDKDVVKVDYDDKLNGENLKDNGNYWETMNPFEAYKKGFMTREEYIGFLKGKIIENVLESNRKNFMDQLYTANNDLLELFYLFGSESKGMTIDGFKSIMDEDNR